MIAERVTVTKNLQTTKYRIFTLYLIQKFARLCHRALTSEQSTSTLLISSPLFPVCFPLLSKVICHFSKVCFTSFRFYERSILAPAFSNQKKPKEDFRFYQGKKKKHRQYSVCLAGTLIGAEGTLSSVSGTTKLLPWKLPSASQRQATIALTVSISICALSGFALCIC